MFWFFSNAEVLVGAGVLVMFVLAALPRGQSPICRRCREINRDEALFCAQCGTRLLGR